MILYDAPIDRSVFDSITGCYCELLVLPNDLQIQGDLPFSMDSSYQLTIRVFQSDGVTFLGDITQYFTFFYAIDKNGDPYFAIRLNSFPAILCGICFELNIRIVKDSILHLDKWTDIYCINNCCGVAQDIDFDSTDSTVSSTTTTLPDASFLSDKCSYPIVRIEGVFPCYSNFSGDRYGTGSTKTGGTSGSIFPYNPVSNIAATFMRSARMISKEVSFNCKVQRTTSTKNWELQSFEIFPSWKVEEILDLLCAPTILIDGESFNWNGAEDPFIPITLRKCPRTYKLKTEFSECTIYQIFGCSDDCQKKSTERYLGFQNQFSKLYNENGAFIGYSPTDLVNYLNAQPGIFEVTEITDAPTSQEYYKLYRIKSTGVTPSYISTDAPFYSNRHYLQEIDPESPNYDKLFGFTSCHVPVIGTITFIAQICQTPIIGTVTFTTQTPTTGMVRSFGNWIISETDENVVNMVNGQVTLNFTTSNNTIIQNPPDEMISLSNMIVGMVDREFTPTTQRVITHENNPNIPEFSYFTIEPDGTLTYSGFTNVTNDFAMIKFVNITYII